MVFSKFCNKEYLYAQCHYAECCNYLDVMLSVVMLSVIALSVIELIVVMLSVAALLSVTNATVDWCMEWMVTTKSFMVQAPEVLIDEVGQSRKVLHRMSVSGTFSDATQSSSKIALTFSCRRYETFFFLSSLTARKNKLECWFPEKWYFPGANTLAYLFKWRRWKVYE
jgi:hypothetical protein